MIAKIAKTEAISPATNPGIIGQFIPVVPYAGGSTLGLFINRLAITNKTIIRMKI
jgi:hypothetical protein